MSNSIEIWIIHVCSNTMSKWKDINNHLRGAIVAAHQSGKYYKVISTAIWQLNDGHQSSQKWSEEAARPQRATHLVLI